MKDFLGNDLRVGDPVVYVSKPGGRRHLVKGFIRSINKVTANVIDAEGCYQGYAYSNQLCKAPQGTPLLASQVVIDKEHLAALEADSEKLLALEAAGVDNWGGYEDAMELREKEE